MSQSKEFLSQVKNYVADGMVDLTRKAFTSIDDHFSEQKNLLHARTLQQDKREAALNLKESQLREWEERLEDWEERLNSDKSRLSDFRKTLVQQFQEHVMSSVEDMSTNSEVSPSEGFSSLMTLPVLDVTSLSPRLQQVFSALQLSMEKSGQDYATIRNKDIAAMADQSIPMGTVSSAIKHLSDAGFITIKRDSYSDRSRRIYLRYRLKDAEKVFSSVEV